MKCVSLRPSQFTTGKSGSVITIGGIRRMKIRKKAEACRPREAKRE